MCKSHTIEIKCYAYNSWHVHGKSGPLVRSTLYYFQIGNLLTAVRKILNENNKQGIIVYVKCNILVHCNLLLGINLRVVQCQHRRVFGTCKAPDHFRLNLIQHSLNIWNLHLVLS